MTTDTFSSLTPLPGGTEAYLETLDEMLRFIASVPGRTRAEFIEWVTGRYSVGRTSMDGYIHTLLRLGVIEGQRSRVLLVSPAGEQLLNLEHPEQKSKFLLNWLLPRYIALADILRIYAEASGPVDLNEVLTTVNPDYPSWGTSVPVARRLSLLLALGCLCQLGGRRDYQITALGREIFRETVDTAVKPPTQEQQMIEALQQASQDGDHPQRFELATGVVFAYLGFEVEHFGGPGETDLLVTAPLGKAAYRVIVDTKARQDGKLYNIEPRRLLSHRQHHGADHIAVVAHSFSGKAIRRDASDSGISLIAINFLSTWCKLHQDFPMNLAVYRSIFQKTGIVEDLPETIQQTAAERWRYATLISQVVQMLSRAQALNPEIRWTNEHIHANLTLSQHNIQYTAEEIEEALNILAHPALRVVYRSSGGVITLAMRPDTGVLTFRSLASVIHRTSKATQSRA